MSFNLTEYMLNGKSYSRAHHAALFIVNETGSDERISYQQLYHDICCLTAGIHQLKKSKGTRVCIQSDAISHPVVELLWLHRRRAGPNLNKVIVVDQMPVNARGKVNRNQLSSLQGTVFSDS